MDRSFAIALGYAAVAALWIILSDRALFVLGLADVPIASVAKGLGFVTLTAVLLYLLLFREQRQLRTREMKLEMLTRLANHSNDILLLEDDQHRIVAVNDRALEAYQCGREGLLGMRVEDLRTEPARGRFAHDRARLATSGRVVYETEHRSRHGRAFDVEVSARAVTIGGQHYVHNSVRDLSTYWREQQWLKLFFDMPFVGMAITSPQSKRWLRVNDELARMLGYQRQVLERMTWTEVTHPQDLDADVRDFERVLAGDIDGYRMRKRFIRADRTVLHTAIDVRCTRRGDGQVDMFIATIQDVTEDVRAAAALAHSRDLYAMLSGTNEAVLHAEGERELLEAACSIAIRSGGFGLAVAHLLDAGGELRPVAVQNNPSFEAQAGRACIADIHGPASSVLATGQMLVNNDLRARSLDETWILVAADQGVASVASLPLRCGGKPIGALTVYAGDSDFFGSEILSTLGQVSDSLSFALDALRARRAQADADRLAEEATLRLRAIIDASTSAIWMVDREGRFLLANQGCAALLGSTAERLVGQMRDAFVSGPVASEHNTNDRRVLELQRPETFEEHLDVDGRRRVYLSVKFPVPDARGQVFAVGGVATDVTDLREATDALRAANQRWASLIENSPAAIFDLDRAGCVRSIWNRTAEELTGVPSSDAIGRPLPITRIDTTPDGSLRRRAFRGETVHGEQITRRLANGRLVHFNASAAPIRGSDGDIEAVLVIVVDITDRVLAQKALAASARTYRVLFESHPAPMWVYDLGNRRILAVNESAVDSYGYSRDEFLALRIDDLRPPEDVPILLAQMRDSTSAIQHSGPWRHRRKDGSEIDVHIDSHALDFEGHDARLVMATDVTERVRAAAALQQSEASLRKLNLELEDRIAARTHELVGAKERAEAADRLKSVFLATVSHELRTPLNSIIGFSDLLLQGLAGALADEQRKQIGIVNAAGRQLLALITDFLDISKIEAGALTLNPTRVDLNELLHADVEGYRKAAEDKGLAFDWSPCPGAYCVTADGKRVRQVVANLVSNAIKFTDRGSVTLRCDAFADHVGISVADTGIGIEAADLPGIFEPFKRLEFDGHQSREGTGLGLAIAKRLAEAMGDGQIGVDSQPGKGSRFWFTLPRAA